MENNSPDYLSPEPEPNVPALPTRRRMLMLGAAGAATIISVRPALAQSVGSVLHCEIPVPGPGNAGKYIAADGTVVAPLTPGSFPGSPTPIKGQDAKNALGGMTIPGRDYQTSQAYANYIRKLQVGQSGFTCFASLQTPGR